MHWASCCLGRGTHGDVRGFGISKWRGIAKRPQSCAVVMAMCVSLLAMSQGTPPWERSRPSWMPQPCVGSPVRQTDWSWRCGEASRARKRGVCTAENDGDDTAPCVQKRESGAEPLRGRRDVPRLKPRARGSQSKALEIATRGSAVHAAEESLKRDMFAAITIGPNQ